jgi:hypothetical protein
MKYIIRWCSMTVEDLFAMSSKNPACASMYENGVVFTYPTSRQVIHWFSWSGETNPTEDRLEARRPENLEDYRSQTERLGDYIVSFDRESE